MLTGSVLLRLDPLFWKTTSQWHQSSLLWEEDVYRNTEAGGPPQVLAPRRKVSKMGLLTLFLFLFFRFGVSSSNSSSSWKPSPFSSASRTLCSDTRANTGVRKCQDNRLGGMIQCVLIKIPGFPAKSPPPYRGCFSSPARRRPWGGPPRPWPPLVGPHVLEPVRLLKRGQSRKSVDCCGNKKKKQNTTLFIMWQLLIVFSQGSISLAGL